MGFSGLLPSKALSCSRVKGSSRGGARSVFSGDITLVVSLSSFSSSVRSSFDGEDDRMEVDDVVDRKMRPITMKIGRDKAERSRTWLPLRGNGREAMGSPDRGVPHMIENSYPSHAFFAFCFLTITVSGFQNSGVITFSQTREQRKNSEKHQIK